MAFVTRLFGGVRVDRIPPRQWRDRPELLKQVATDSEATLDRAMKEARLLVDGGWTTYAVVCCARLKLPSGIVGYRFFAIDAEMFTLLGSQVGHAEVVCRVPSGDALLPSLTTKKPSAALKPNTGGAVPSPLSPTTVPRKTAQKKSSGTAGRTSTATRRR